MDETLKFERIVDLMCCLGLEPPRHPLIVLVNYDEVHVDMGAAGKWFVLDFYKISFKKDFRGGVSYGAGKYNFRDGGIGFVGPGQAVQMTAAAEDFQGYALYFHRDLLNGRPLSKRIFGYGFFDYFTDEALSLSEAEKELLTGIFASIARELNNDKLDAFTEDVLVSQLELLLIHSNRFYIRQFHTRSGEQNSLIHQMNNYLLEHLFTPVTISGGLPSPQDVAVALGVSQRYLSDLLKTITGKTTQQHIHAALIEKAKILLRQTNLTTAEIAYRLGFEHPQSFNKLFKQRTNLSPAQFRRGPAPT